MLRCSRSEDVSRFEFTIFENAARAFVHSLRILLHMDLKASINKRLRSLRGKSRPLLERLLFRSKPESDVGNTSRLRFSRRHRVGIEGLRSGSGSLLCNWIRDASYTSLKSTYTQSDREQSASLLASSVPIKTDQAWDKTIDKCQRLTVGLRSCSARNPENPMSRSHNRLQLEKLRGTRFCSQSMWMLQDDLSN